MLSKSLLHQNKRIGLLTQVGTHVILLKSITKPSQRLLKPPSYCCDSDAWREAIEDGISAILIKDVDRGILVGATAPNFNSKAFHVSRGHGEQLGLPLGQ